MKFTHQRLLNKISMIATFSVLVLASVVTFMYTYLTRLTVDNPIIAYASNSASDEGNNTNIHYIYSSNDGYEVIILKGKKYIRNDESDNRTPKLIEKGYNGRSFIVPSKDYLSPDAPSTLFKKLYDKDGDGEIDEKYKNPEHIDNSHAGEEHDGTTIPYRSEINPKYPHVVDSGFTDDSKDSNNKPGVWEYNPDGKYKESDGVIDENDTIVVARKPFTIDEKAEENVVKDDGSVVLTDNYEIHVNDGDHIDKKDDVYEVGTKPKVEETPIPFSIRYEEDDSLEHGVQQVIEQGSEGLSRKTTTFEIEPESGHVIENPSKVEILRNPVTRVIKIGVKPVVTEILISYDTRYEIDPTKDEHYREVIVHGVTGKTTTTITYSVDLVSGVVTEHEPIIHTDDAVTEVIRIGKKKELPATDAAIPLMPIISMLLIVAVGVIQKLKSKEQA